MARRPQSWQSMLESGVMCAHERGEQKPDTIGANNKTTTNSRQDSEEKSARSQWKKDEQEKKIFEQGKICFSPF